MTEQNAKEHQAKAFVPRGEISALHLAFKKKKRKREKEEEGKIESSFRGREKARKRTREGEIERKK